MSEEIIKQNNIKPSKGEEIANSITHGIGAALSIAALVLLTVAAVLKGNVWHIVSFVLFGVSLIILYLMSTLYHAIANPSAKKIFEVLDHSSIYILIAGSYTPYSLTILREHGGWILFGVAWGSVIVGVILKAFFTGRFRLLSTLIYIALGWMIVFFWNNLYSNVDFITIVFLVAGGISYTLGSIFFMMQKIKWFHAIWHLFVLGGSICHFFACMFLL